MRTTSKYIKTILIIVSIYTLPSFAIAQTNAPSNQPTNNDYSDTCKVCASTPEQIENFITLTTNVIGVLGTKYTTGTRAGQYKVFGPRQGGLYGSITSNKDNSSIYKNIVGGTLRNLDQQQSYIRTTAVLMGMYGRDIITDGALGFAVVAQPWPMVRDYQRLLDVDTMITDKIHELGIAGGYSRTIDGNTIGSIRDFMDNEMGDEKIFEDVTIEDDMKAKDILQVLVKLNKKHKNLIVLSSKANSEGTEDIEKNSTISIDLNTGYREKLKTDYSCARLGGKGAMKCSKSFSQFKKSIKNITTNFIEKGPKQSLEKIKVASRRLKTRGQQISGKTNNDTYKKNLSDYEQREAELLSIQGVEKRTSNSLTGFLGGNPFRGVLANIEEAKNKAPSIINSIKDGGEKLTSKALQGAKVKQDIKGESKEGNNSPGIIDNIKSFFGLNQKSEVTKKIEKNVVATLTQILQDHDEQIKLQSLASTDDSIEKLSETLLSLRFLNNVIYEPDNQKTMYENIVRTCELQCSNLGGTCR